MYSKYICSTYDREGDECLLWLSQKIKWLPRANLIRSFNQDLSRVKMLKIKMV